MKEYILTIIIGNKIKIVTVKADYYQVRDSRVEFYIKSKKVTCYPSNLVIVKEVISDEI